MLKKMNEKMSTIDKVHKEIQKKALNSRFYKKISENIMRDKQKLFLRQPNYNNKKDQSNMKRLYKKFSKHNKNLFELNFSHKNSEKKQF